MHISKKSEILANCFNGPETQQQQYIIKISCSHTEDRAMPLKISVHIKVYSGIAWFSLRQKCFQIK